MRRIGIRGLEKHVAEIVRFQRRNVAIHGRVYYGDIEEGHLGSDYPDKTGREVYFIQPLADTYPEGVDPYKKMTSLGNEFIEYRRISLRDGDIVTISDSSDRGFCDYEVCLQNATDK